MVAVFKGEATAVLQALSALLALLVSFGLPGLTVDQAGLIVAVVAAVIGAVNALLVRPVAPTVFTTVIVSGSALLGSYGLSLDQGQVGSLTAAVIAVMALLTRVQSGPVHPGE